MGEVKSTLTGYRCNIFYKQIWTITGTPLIFASDLPGLIKLALYPAFTFMGNLPTLLGYLIAIAASSENLLAVL